MARWLFKTEPSEFSYDDLERDGQTVWDGVSNALALKHLRQVRAKDEVLCYHTGKEKAVVGSMRVVAAATTEDKTPRVTVKAHRRWPTPVTLAQLKADTAFADWELLRLPRLSIMPIDDAHWQRLSQLAGL